MFDGGHLLFVIAGLSIKPGDDAEKFSATT